MMFPFSQNKVLALVLLSLEIPTLEPGRPMLGSRVTEEAGAIDGVVSEVLIVCFCLNEKQCTNDLLVATFDYCCSICLIM